MLAACAVGQAGAAIRRDNEVVRTSASGLGTLAILSNANETEVRASTIVVLARVVIVELPERVVDVNVIGPVGSVHDDFHVVSSVLVGPHYRLEIPI